MSPSTAREPSSVALAIAGVLCLAWLAYAVLVVQQILLGLVPLAVAGMGYFLWRLLVAIEAIAAAQQQIAETDESGPD
jgi:hypothetical protein